jgi:hypothetical protein
VSGKENEAALDGSKAILQVCEYEYIKKCISVHKNKGAGVVVSMNNMSPALYDHDLSKLQDVYTL